MIHILVPPVCNVLFQDFFLLIFAWFVAIKWYGAWVQFSLSLSCLDFAEILKSAKLCLTKFGKFSVIVSSSIFPPCISLFFSFLQELKSQK